MANDFTYHVMKDTTEHTVIKLTGRFDGSSQESNTARIQANTLYGAMDSSKANLLSSVANTGPLPYYGLAINRVWYDCPTSNASVEMFWQATTPRTIMFLNGNSEYDASGNWITISNQTAGEPGSNGNIGFTTRNMGANDSYTIILELRKDNTHYQRGQFNDPAAFNYGEKYGMKP